MRAGLVAWTVIGILLVASVALFLLYQVRVIFPPLILALVVVILLNPVVSVLQRHGVPRVFGTLLIYVLFVALLFLVGMLLVPPIGRQVRALQADWPQIQKRAFEGAQSLADRVGVSLNVSQLLDRAGKELGSGVAQITEFARGALHVVLIFVLGPIFALYLLIDLPRLRDAFISHLPPRHRDEWLMLLQRIGQAVGGFFRGQLAVALIVGVLSVVALSLVKIPFAVLIGLVAGLFNIIPLIGPFIGGGLAVIVGAVSGGMDKALLAALAMLAVQQIDNHFISPNVMGRALRLHPVTIMLALLAGGTAGGLFGMLVAVPGTAVAKILIMHYYSAQVLGGKDSEELEGVTIPGGTAHGPRRRKTGRRRARRGAQDRIEQDARAVGDLQAPASRSAGADVREE